MLARENTGKKNYKKKIAIYMMIVLSVVAVPGCNNKKTGNEMTTGETEYIEPTLKAGYEDRVVDDSIQAPYLPEIKSINDDGIHVYWKKPEVAQGFELFRSYDRYKDFEFVADIPLARHGSFGDYYDTSYDESYKQIYYIVCCYVKDEAGNKTYSNFAKVVTARYRENLKITRDHYFLASGYSRKLYAYHGWGIAGNAVFTSDNEKVAKVDKDGVITGVGKGVCNVSVYYAETDETLNCQVTIDRDADPMLDEYESRFVRDEEKGNYYYNPDAEVTNKAVITLGGDMMCMAKQQRACKDEDGNYYFNNSYKYIKPIYDEADYNLANLETVIDPTWPYYCEEGVIDLFPNCNAPTTYLDAIKWAGIDGVITSNNHNCDAGVHGVLETQAQLDRFDIGHTGLRDSYDDYRHMIVDVNGIKLGFLSYTDSFNTKDYNWDPEDVKSYLNHYGPKRAKRDIANLRAAGAEYIIVYMHWGTKNFANPIAQQQQEAQELADFGADYIAGSHSHIVQPYTTITSKDGKEVPCIYCMGDYNTSINQVPGNRDSVLMRLELEKDEDGNVVLKEHNYIPCYTYSTYGDDHYVTIPMNSNLNGGLTDLYKYRKVRRRIINSIGREISEYMPPTKK